ncbi:MAG: aryl-sulfate sulfotransferase [Chitinophagales bacterium]|nr:aryl-sulfate sulfotransferase [Chitinophagaceae bacterium]MCB9063791.1 aryl-sulfate sulfotransferase [Chitinophagales bacterium]
MKHVSLIAILMVVSICKVTAQQTIGLFTNTPQSYDGYTLFAPIDSKETYLIDNCGRKVHSWTSQYNPGHSCYLLENGMLLRAGRMSGVGAGGIVEMIDWNSNVVWSYSTTGVYGSQHHDIEPLPNGNVLLIVQDNHTKADAIQAGVAANVVSIISEQIVEVKPNLTTGGTSVVWQWKAWEHLIQDHDSMKMNYGVVAQHPERIDLNFEQGALLDWLHVNSIGYNAKFDQIILSVHGFSEFWIIDHSTTTVEAKGRVGGNYGKGGDLLYRWGNPQAYRQGTANDQKLFLQHNAHWIPEGYPDAGKIILFNNQAGTPYSKNYSTVDVVNVPVNSVGEYTYSSGAYGPTGFDWTYKASTPTEFYSAVISGVQRMENGNTLICQGVGGRFFEVDNTGNTVWEYVNPINGSGPMTQNTTPTQNNVFRCTRYAPTYPAFQGKTLTPQGYIESGSTYSCTLYPASVNDTKLENHISVYPNPTSDILNIHVDIQADYSIKLYNINGQCLVSKQVENNSETIQLNISALNSGVYFLSISNGEEVKMEKVIID